MSPAKQVFVHTDGQIHNGEILSGLFLALCGTNRFLLAERLSSASPICKLVLQLKDTYDSILSTLVLHGEQGPFKMLPVYAYDIPLKTSGPRLNINIVFPRYGESRVTDETVVKPSYL